MRQQVRGPYRDRVMGEADANQHYSKRLQAIKDRLDLFGDRGLTGEEAALVERHPGFFFPEPRGPRQLA